METKEIVRATIAVHEAAEELNKLIKSAVSNKEFTMTLSDSRKLRDLVDDCEKFLNQAWMDSMEIPTENLTLELKTHD